MEALDAVLLGITVIAFVAPVFVLLAILGLEFMSLHFNGKVRFQRRYLRFRLPLMFAVTTAVAVICSLTGAIGFHAADLPILALVFVALIWAMYLLGIMYKDILQAFGLIRPRRDLSRFAGRRNTCEQIVVPDAAAEEDSGQAAKRRKKKRRRRTSYHRLWHGDPIPHAPIGRNKF